MNVETQETLLDGLTRSADVIDSEKSEELSRPQFNESPRNTSWDSPAQAKLVYSSLETNVPVVATPINDIPKYYLPGERRPLIDISLFPSVFRRGERMKRSHSLSSPFSSQLSSEQGKLSSDLYPGRVSIQGLLACQRGIRTIPKRSRKTAPFGQGSSCHQCKKQYTRNELAYCSKTFDNKTTNYKRSCHKKFCAQCLVRFYKSINPSNILGKTPEESKWFCPVCQGYCTCGVCKKKIIIKSKSLISSPDSSISHTSQKLPIINSCSSKSGFWVSNNNPSEPSGFMLTGDERISTRPSVYSKHRNLNDNAPLPSPSKSFNLEFEYMFSNTDHSEMDSLCDPCLNYVEMEHSPFTFEDKSITNMNDMDSDQYLL